MKQLNERQRQFVSNKIAGCTNKAAALAAGYSPNGAAQAGDRLMREPAIRAALKAAGKNTPAVDAKPSNTPKMPRAKYADPVAFLEDVMNHAELPIAMRADAAKQLLPYKHARMGETGKKEKAKDKARTIARGGNKFATKVPPQLTVVRNE
ncbi:terminase small subunit [Luteimonas sp. RD2P54]|uniref:Terminase small subunit n=1 Tax=Luteimonas endophytica TaxID=3042023 RepID=A0ABT6JBX4_9GAMM|nr:terminase small subunit [Luteimonas endophytica]MDH5824322.1 terminase small subunit [Luteimonas endophytica]